MSFLRNNSLILSGDESPNAILPNLCCICEWQGQLRHNQKLKSSAPRPQEVMEKTMQESKGGHKKAWQKMSLNNKTVDYLQILQKMIRKAKSMALGPAPWPCKIWISLPGDHDPWGMEHVRSYWSFSAYGRKERLTPHFVENHTHWKPQVAEKKEGVKVVGNPSSSVSMPLGRSGAPKVWKQVQPVSHWEAPGRNISNTFDLCACAANVWCSYSLTKCRNIASKLEFSKLDTKSASPASAVTISGFGLQLLKDAKNLH